MGLFGAFDAVNESNNDKNAQNNIEQQKKFEKTVTPQQAQAVGQIYKNSPWISPRMVLDMAKQGVSQQAVDAVSNVEGKRYIVQNDPQTKDQGNWFHRNVYGNAKALSRWTFAALQFTPDLAQNIASQAFSGNDPAGMDGWFASTQLGQMAGDKNAGSGFFFGGEAATTQAQKAKDFRGSINGHAWTIGRGAADIVFTPGTKEYSLLSGFFDAGVNIFADPTLYAGQALKAAKTGEAAKGMIGTKKISQVLADQLVERGLVQTDKIPTITKEAALAAGKIARGEAGLHTAESIAFEQSKFYSWFDKNARAGRMAERLADHAATASKAISVGALDEEATLLERGKAAAKILEDFGDKIDPEVAMRLATADEPMKVKAILGEAAARLGTEAGSNILPESISAVKGTGATFAAKQYARERVPLYRSIRNSRFWTEIPAEGAIVNGTGMERSRSVGTMRKWMQGLKIDKELPEKYNELMGKAMVAFSSDNVAARQAATDQLYEDFLYLITDHAKGSRKITAQAIDLAKAEKGKIRAYGISANGLNDDGGTVQMLKSYISEKQLAKFTPEELDTLRLQGPSALVELSDKTYVLPDYRKYRALTGNRFMGTGLTRDAAGDQRYLVGAAEQLQQEVWKPMVLATGGYIVRNMIDSHIRIGAKGYESFFTHPFHMIQTVLGSRYVGGLEGVVDESGRVVAKTFEDALGDVTDVLTPALKSYKDHVEGSVYQHTVDALTSNERLIRTENLALISRTSDKIAHTTGYVDNLGQIHADPIMSRVAALWHLPAKDRLEEITKWLDGTPDGKVARKTIVDYFKKGVRISDATGEKHIFVKFTDASDTELIASWVDKAATARVGTILGGGTKDIDQDLRFIVAHNRVPLMEAEMVGGVATKNKVIARHVEENVDALVTVDPDMPKEVGAVVKLGDNEGVIVQIDKKMVDDPFNPGTMIESNVAKVQPVEAGTAFTRIEKDPALLGSDALRDMIDYKGKQGLLADTVKVATRHERGKSVGLDKISEALDSGVKWFFNSLVGKSTQKLERSPLYRQAFYKQVADKAHLLSPEEQTKLQDNIVRFVEELNADLAKEGKRASLTAEKYVGNKKIYDQIFGKVATGDGTIAELEQFSSIVAVEELKTILYNAQKKSNLEDQLRIIAPFATAFRETLGKYADYLIEDPSRIRKTQLAYNAINYDNDNPDNVGSGWFGKDAATGNHVFTFPIGGWAGSLLKFPVRGAFQVLQLPGVGPVAQIAASELIPDTPRLDFVRNMILPYGKQGVSSLAPSWAKRGIEAIRADTTNMESIFGNTYGEAVKYLASTGEYNLNDPNDTAKLYADAKNKARILAGLRALFQFTGPSSPKIDFGLETDGGDIVASSIAQEFYKMQAKNPDTAVQTFVDTFGEDAFIYLGHKTEPTINGLESTKAFGDWQRNNGDLFNEYKNVAGYFAPGGDTFSFEVWNRQVLSGDRKHLTAPEMVAAAQYRLGAAVYRSKRNQLGDKMSTNQREWLAQWRVALNEQYPGFPAKSNFNPGEFDNTIKDLKRAMQDTRLQGNDIANALNEYLGARDKALANAAQAGLKSLDSPRAQPLRDWLGSIGQAITQKTPEFSRIFEDLLAAEVD